MSDTTYDNGNGHTDLKPMSQTRWALNLVERLEALQGGKGIDVTRKRARVLDMVGLLLDMPTGERDQFQALVTELVSTAPSTATAIDRAITATRQELGLIKTAKS